VRGVARPPSPARRQAEALRAAGLAVELFVFHGGRSLYNYAIAWTRLRHRFRAHRYDLVHAHFAPTGLLALPKRIPLIVTLRRSDVGAHSAADRPPGHLRRLSQAAARLLVRRADAVIVPSEEARRGLRTRTPVHVIPPELEEPALTARLLEVYRSVLGTGP
ncbi:MAG: glycosyltransferase family 4 protein, partial [Gemmatimonadales bacterium]